MTMINLGFFSVCLIQFSRVFFFSSFHHHHHHMMITKKKKKNCCPKKHYSTRERERENFDRFVWLKYRCFSVTVVVKVKVNGFSSFSSFDDYIYHLFFYLVFSRMIFNNNNNFYFSFPEHFSCVFIYHFMQIFCFSVLFFVSSYPFWFRRILFEQK